MSIIKSVDKITSRTELALFVKELRTSLLNEPEEWENIKLVDYLEAMEAWIIDMEGYYKNNNLEVPENPSWKTMAEILYAAKDYE